MTQEIAASDVILHPAFQRTSRNWLRSIIASQEFGVAVILAAMCLYLSLKTNSFTLPQNISNVILAFSWIAIAAFGQTLVIITGGIDLSTGSVMALSGLAAAYFISGDKSPWAVHAISDKGREIMVVDNQYVPIALLAGCVMGMFLGMINGLLVAWGGLPAFIATLGMMSVARGFCYGLLKGQPVRQLNSGFRSIGQDELSLNMHLGPVHVDLGYDLPYPTIIMVVLVIIVTVFLTRLVWGYRIYAIGGNEQAAQLSGINTRHVKLLAFSLSGLLAGIGGTLMTARIGVAAPTAANGYELDAIAAVFIGGASVKGGKGTIIGTLIGAATMQVLRNGLNLVGADVYWQPAAIGFVIIMAIMLDRARSNPQVQAYFHQLEGRIAVVSVLLAAIVSFIAALVYGLGADAMISVLITLPFFSVVYFFFYRGVVNPIDTPWKRWTYAGLSLVLSVVILLAVWAVVRFVVIRLLQPKMDARDGGTLQSASL
jgi:ribose transport system permease protein